MNRNGGMEICRESRKERERYGEREDEGKEEGEKVAGRQIKMKNR